MLLFTCLRYVLSRIHLAVLFQSVIIYFKLVILFVGVNSEDVLQFRFQGKSDYENNGFFMFTLPDSFLRAGMITVEDRELIY